MTDEPARPERGRTAEERGPDTSAAEERVQDAATVPQRVAAAARPGFLLSQADGYPVGVKQFLQFCLVIVYPAWLFALGCMWAIYGVFWLLFLPLRMVMKRKDPEAYAASQQQ